MLKEDGVAHVPSFVSPDVLKEIEKEYDSIFDKIPSYHDASLDESGLTVHPEGDYMAGKHLRVPPSGYHSIPVTLSVFNTPQFKNLVDSYLGIPNQFCMQVFMSNEFKVIKEGGLYRNQHLHFDPYASLKFFLYLSDVDEDTGATYYVPGSRNTGKHYRETKLDLNDSTGLNGGTKHRLEDYPDPPPYTKEDAVPVIAKRGDLLILDTDTLHYGGVLKAEANRKVIILHNRPL